MVGLWGFGVLGSRKETVYMISKLSTIWILSKSVKNTEEYLNNKQRL